MPMTYIFAVLAALPWLGLLVVGGRSLNLGACPSAVGSFFSSKGKKDDLLINFDVSDSESDGTRSDASKETTSVSDHECLDDLERAASVSSVSSSIQL